MAEIVSDPTNFETLDFAFIDADKVSYLNYYEQCLKLMRKGGIIMFDNILWYGQVCDAEQDADTKAIVECGTAIGADPRVRVHCIYLSDGLLIAEKL